jgi:hypothetical protein
MDHRLVDAGRVHFATCRLLAATADNLDEAVLEASRQLSWATLRAADVDEATASAFLQARIEAAVEASQGEAGVGFSATVVFYSSVFNAAVRSGLGGALVVLAGHELATEIEMVLMLSLDAGELEVGHSREAAALDRVGEILDIAFYRVFVRGIRCAAAILAAREAESRIVRLVWEAEAEAIRLEAVDLVGAARQQTINDENKKALLATFAAMLEPG